MLNFTGAGVIIIFISVASATALQMSGRITEGAAGLLAILAACGLIAVFWEKLARIF